MFIVFGPIHIYGLAVGRAGSDRPTELQPSSTARQTVGLWHVNQGANEEMKLGWNSMWVFWTSILNSLKGSQNPKNKQNAYFGWKFFSCAFAANACGFHAFAAAHRFRRINTLSRICIAPKSGKFCLRLTTRPWSMRYCVKPRTPPGSRPDCGWSLRVHHHTPICDMFRYGFRTSLTS